MMKHKITLALLFGAAILTGCNKMEKTESGIEYKIVEHEDDARMATEKDILLCNLRLSTETSDSVIIETFTENNPRHIPADEPVLKELFAMLSKNDSVVFFVNADTLFQKSFGSPRPANMVEGERVKFIIRVVDIFTQEEMQKKRMEQMGDLMTKDSVAMMQYIATLKDVQQTASGLRYIVVKKTNGKQAQKGNKVSMLYEGRLLSGEVFDGNMDGSRPPFEFAVGLGQVIPGWDEAVQMMKEGEEYKFIIPWKLAYGPQPVGPIPPYSTLVFDVKLIKIN
jgi:FKBP-type peptidyl-prolyl cis-trans isomerase FkpA